MFQKLTLTFVAAEIQPSFLTPSWFVKEFLAHVIVNLSVGMVE